MNWLTRLLSRGKPHAPTQQTDPVGATVIRLDDHSYFANSDILDGMQFAATLQIRTPLSVLQHHDEIFRGPPSEAPVYGTQADGIWVFKSKTFKELGIELEEIPNSQHASDIGPIAPSDYLPFLIQFRSIVESDSSPDQQKHALMELSKQSAHFKVIWGKLCASYGDFPASFFYSSFKSLPGIGGKLAKSLYDAGYRSIDEITNSSIERLTAVPGLGPATASTLTALARRLG
jgi:hypothetical protein